MKKCIIISILTFLTLKSTYSQSSFSVGTKWTYVADYFYENIFDTLVSVWVEKDTAVNQKKCHWVVSNISSNSIYSFNGIYYEEGKQIFVYDNSNKDFKLLYDFDAVKGDSWEFEEGLTVQVDSVLSKK